MSWEADLAVAHAVADEAAKVAMRFFGEGVSATLKCDGTPVTAADRAVEELLRAQFGEFRPDDAVLGEELGAHGFSDRVWIVDPIDGTSFFASGDPNWRIHIALQVQGAIELAVVDAPALGLRWWAIPGQGAYEAKWPSETSAPIRLATSTTADIESAVVDALPAEERGRLPSAAQLAGPSPLALVELVRGEIDVVLIEGSHIWDHAPWILLVEEAGGQFTNPLGGRTGDQGGGLYSNTPLHEPLLESLGYPTR